MTLDDLLNNNYEFLASLSDAQLKEVLAPYFTVTRPEESKRLLNNRSSAAKQGAKKKKKLSELEEKMSLLEERMKDIKI